MRFEDLGLVEPVLRAVTVEGYTTPTPIQAKAIPPVIAGHDVLGCAQTGTGKTAAFALPILHMLFLTKGQTAPATPAPAAPPPSGPTGQSNRNAPRGRFGSRPDFRPPARPSTRKIRALVLSPTRELATQISDSFQAYGRFTGLRHTVIFGGVKQNAQTRALRDGVDIVVATPGRLLDLMNQGYVDLSGVEMFVLDEADRMLDMGFIPDIRRIVAKIPEKRQTLFFSATMPSDIKKLAGAILKDPVTITVEPEAPAAQRIEQSVYFVDRRSKSSLLKHLLENTSITRAIVFTRTKHGADHVAKHLYEGGIEAEVIHGNKTQRARQKALDNFKSGKAHVLLATDIAARGIDVDGISHVFNFDIPDVAETYVHRIGRTARAGASGKAIAFCDADERHNLRDIERLTKVPVTVMDDHPDHMKVRPPKPMAQRPPQGPNGLPGKVGGPGAAHTHQHTPRSGGSLAGRSTHQKSGHVASSSGGPRQGPHNSRQGKTGGGGGFRSRGK